MRRYAFGFVLVLAGATAAGSDWPKYCANEAMTGVAASGGAISSATAGSLEQLWSAKLSGPVASSPTVVNDVVYIGDWSGNESALSAVDGQLIARQNLGTTTAPQCVPSALGITSAAAYADGAIYLAGGDSSFYALDATTLAIRWSTILGDNSATGGYYGWCSPVVIGYGVLQGLSSNCDDPFVPGALVRLNRFDGTFMDVTFLVHPEWPYTFAGAGIWTSPAVDTDNGYVFVVTGSADELDDGYAYSIVRLALDSLQVEDSWRVDPGNVQDADWGSSPTLFTNANGIQLVGAGQKNGNYYAFARGDLASGPVWRTPVAVGGACPLCANGTLSTAAFDGERLYLGTGQPPGSSAFGSVAALDPTTGAIIWQHEFDKPVIAPVSYANGVVFTTAGSLAVALDAQTGALLWSFKTAGQCVGGVAITDRGIFFGDLAGSFYAFGIPETKSRTRAVE